ncbi:MAG TPA: rhodanese-like domain-containing protein [Stenomitos sp.]
MQKPWRGLIIGSLLLAGCGQAGRLTSATVVRVQARDVQNVTIQQAQAAIASDPSLLVLDVREASEYEGGHIANALLRPVGSVATWSQTLAKDAHILCVCRSGHRSSIAAGQLVANGFTHVASMTGGMMAWTAAGFPVVAGQR